MEEETMNRMNAEENGHQMTKEDITALVNDGISPVQFKDKGPPWWRSQRYILAYFLFTGVMNVFFQRVNFSIAIICMVNHTAISSHSHAITHINNSLTTNIISTSYPSEEIIFHVKNESTEFHNFEDLDELNKSRNLEGNYSEFSEGINSVTEYLKSITRTDLTLVITPSINDSSVINFSNSSSKECGDEKCSDDYTATPDVMEDGPLVWDKQLQGILLGGIYWTYLIAQIPSNLIVRKMKKKTVVAWSMAVMSVMTLLVHVTALWSPWALFAVRLVQGACTGLAIIAMYGMLGKWAPPRERGSLITLAISGQNLGNIIVFPVSGILCKYGFLGGWPSIFYVFGIVGLIWIVLFHFFTDESPSTQRFITDKEKKYINSSLSHSAPTRHVKVPWVGIMKSAPFWGIVIGQFSFTWGLLLILSTLPQYMLEVLKFDIKSNGVFTMLPYIALMIVTQTAGSVSDSVIRRQLLSVLWTRKVCVLIANLVPAVLLAAMSFLDSSQAALAISLLVLSVGASGFSLSAFMVNPYDIAPRFATELMMIINTAGSAPGILTSYIVASVTKDQTREQWQIVFFITAGVYVVGAICYCLMAQAVVQPWAMDGGSYEMKVISDGKNDEKMSTKDKDKDKQIMLNDC